MNRLCQQLCSLTTAIGYLLVVTWGALWHDHSDFCSHSHASITQQVCEESFADEHRCCAHSHAGCDDVERSLIEIEQTPYSPCESPLQDDDCAVCQTLAHPPMSPPSVVVIDHSEPVFDRIAPLQLLPGIAIPWAYDSRGPPAIEC